MRGLIYKILIGLVLTFGLQNIAFAHPIHVSVINMDVKPDGKLVFSVKLFVDDFQTVVNQHNQTNFILIGGDIDPEVIKPSVINYISDKLTFGEGNSIKKEAYQLNEIKINEESIWLYFELDVKINNRLNVNNSLMCELFDDQSNLMIINANGQDLAYRFTNDKTSYLFTFD